MDLLSSRLIAPAVPSPAARRRVARRPDQTTTVSAAVGQWLIARIGPNVASRATVIDLVTVGRDAGRRGSFPHRVPGSGLSLLGALKGQETSWEVVPRPNAVRPAAGTGTGGGR